MCPSKVGSLFWQPTAGRLRRRKAEALNKRFIDDPPCRTIGRIDVSKGKGFNGIEEIVNDTPKDLFKAVIFVDREPGSLNKRVISLMQFNEACVLWF